MRKTHTKIMSCTSTIVMIFEDFHNIYGMEKYTMGFVCIFFTEIQSVPLICIPSSKHRGGHETELDGSKVSC